MRISSITVLLVSALSLAAESGRAQNVIHHVRVIMQVVEVPHAALTKLTTGETLPGREIHERAMKLTESGEAEIVETCVLIVRSGEKALAESIAEVIFPSEYEPPGSDLLPLNKADSNAFRYKRAFESSVMTSFETRNTGVTLEIHPTALAGGRMVDLLAYFEMIDRASLTTWTEFRDQWGDASVRMPEFDSRKLTSAITLVPGVFDLWTVFTPKPAAVPAAVTRQLLFVRADLVPILTNP
jgi:hypothetical protein